MHKLFKDILDGIPDYQEFLTLDEMDESSRKLAEIYPETVEIFEMGRSRDNHPLLCLKIGNGSKNALLFGCPHPNEPIGAMMLEYFTRELAQNKELCDAMDYTWYVVKAWDADGFRLNEGWLKGPYTIYNYSRNFFRPAGHKQVDWTFPIDYKDLHFHKPIPETEAMMKLIDDIKPHFIYSLHNAGFGGAYWYVTDSIPEVYENLHAAADEVKVPLNLGEPEAPYCELFAPAIYRGLGIKDEYDFMERYGEVNIGEKINVGTSSEDYAFERHGSFTLVTELPYFCDPRIMDQSEGTITRREAIKRRLDMNEKQNEFVLSSLKRTEKYFDSENPFYLALKAFTKPGSDASSRKMIEAPEYNRLAMISEEFDNLLISQFYKSLSYGMLIRANEYELQSMDKTGEQNEEKHRLLTEAVAECERAHRELTDMLERDIHYTVVPIRKLVYIQLACGLFVADHLNRKLNG